MLMSHTWSEPFAQGVLCVYDIATVVLDGELAVPCTRNPLQRGGTPLRGPTLRDWRRKWR